MRFAEPLVLWWLVSVPVLAGLALVAAWRRRRALAVFSGSELNAARFRADVSVHKRAVKSIALLVAATAGIVAAARPQWGHGTETIARKGIDLAIVLDTSKSMAAADVAPFRLARGVRAASSLLDHLQGDRVALVTFAGKPAVACPLTLDHEAVRLFLDAVDVESVSVPGTALSLAVAEGVRALGPAVSGGTTAKGRALVVISDGEDHEGGVDDAVSALKRAGVVVYAVGCGTDQGAPIPEGASGAYKKDSQGRLVTTRLDEKPLRSLAIETGGKYFRATAAEGEVEEIAKALSAMDASGSGTVLKTRWVERFQIPLAVALFALVLETLLTDRKES